MTARANASGDSAMSAVLPPAPPGMPFSPVEFHGLTVTPYVNQAGRLAYSLKATGIRAPGRGRPGPETREVAA